MFSLWSASLEVGVSLLRPQSNQNLQSESKWRFVLTGSQLVPSSLCAPSPLPHLSVRPSVSAPPVHLTEPPSVPLDVFFSLASLLAFPCVRWRRGGPSSLSAHIWIRPRANCPSRPPTPACRLPTSSCGIHQKSRPLSFPRSSTFDVFLFNGANLWRLLSVSSDL